MRIHICYVSKFVSICKFVTMPKKSKKNKFNHVPIYKNILTLDKKEHADVLRSLSEMFPTFDSSVVKLIVDESENNVEQAIETLISLSNNDHASAQESELKPGEIQNEVSAIKFSNIDKIYQNSLNTEPDKATIYQDTPTCSTSFNSINCVSYPFKNVEPQFVIPSVPMLRPPTPHKSYDLWANQSFWNVSDSKKHFSTCPRGCDNEAGCSIKRTIEKIQSSSRILVLLRGLPGSGKSSLALKLKSSGMIFSTDDFFMKRGKYLFDCTMLSAAHAWNKERTKKALQEGITPVIIDNTNVEAWEMKPYVLMGKEYNYEIIILEPDTPWKFNIKELAFRNKHGVPKSKIALMKERFRKDITIEKILATKRLFAIDNEDDVSKDSDNCKVNENRDGLTTTVNYNIMEENRISLQAVIHQEDNSADEKYSFNNNDLQSSVSHFSVSENSVSNQPIAVCNLDELRSLTRNDREDSQSSVNGSLQEITGWEAITEPDEGFRWSTSSEVLKCNAKSSSTDSLSPKESTDPLSSEDDSSSSSISVENLSSSGEDSSVVLDKLKTIVKSDQTPFNCDIKVSKSNFETTSTDDVLSSEKTISDLTLRNEKFNKCMLSKSDLKNGEKFCAEVELVNDGEVVNYSLNAPESDDVLRSSMKHLAISYETIEDNKNNGENLNFKPKPCRNDSVNILTLSKDNFLDKSFKEINAENAEECSLHWNIPNEKTNDSFIEKQHSDVQIPSTPKPQRKICENTFYEVKKKVKTNCVNHKPFLNISVDSDWKFPNYIQDDSNPTTSTSISRRSLSFKMSSHSQTEMRDFNLLHKIEVGNNTLDCYSYKIINPRPNNGTYDKDFDSIPSPNNLKKLVSFDKSTSTDDLVDEVEIFQKLVYLQERFPEISKEDLLHHLEICNNDVKWLCNLLLDWGYKYNVPEGSFEDSTEEKLNSDESDFSYKKFVERRERRYSKTAPKNSFDNTSDENSSTLTSSNDVANEPKEVKLKETTDRTLQLMLDPAFARDLEKHFGPVTNSANRCIEVDFELAELIYKKWKVTDSNYKQNVTKGKKCKYKKKLKYTPTKVTKEPSSLTEIMDQELALQLHNKEKLREIEDFTTRCNRLELYKLFPGVNEVFIDELYENNKFSFEKSVQQLSGQSEADLKESTEKMKKTNADPDVLKKSQILKDFETGNCNDWAYKKDLENCSKSEATFIPLEAAVLRDEASEHCQLHKEFKNKAQKAFQHGSLAVGSFYSEQGRRHAEMAKVANKKASTLIAKTRNSMDQWNTLDLHGLYSKEAINTLEKFLRERKGEMKRNKQKTPLTVNIITGKGKHSMHGPKLQPAVENYLRSNGYHYYTKGESGKLDVTILPC